MANPSSSGFYMAIRASPTELNPAYIQKHFENREENPSAPYSGSGRQVDEDEPYLPFHYIYHQPYDDETLFLVDTPSIVRRNAELNGATQLEGTNIFYYDDLLIGRGATSNIYQGYHITEDRPAAVKRVRAEDVNIFKNELEIWMTIGSTVSSKSVNIVQLYEWSRWMDGGQWPAYYFAMELATSDLKKKVTERYESYANVESRKQIRKKHVGYLKDAAKGLQWLHSKNIIHRDIKPENILIFEDHATEKDTAKLADFGISKKLENLSTGTDSKGQGTSDWMAPEAIEALHREEKFRTSRRIDIFSFGLTCYFTMSGGNHPFQRSPRHGRFITLNIKDKEIPPSSLLQEVDEGVRDEHTAEHLIQWMLCKSPNQRPQISQILDHPFFWRTRRSLRFLIDVARTFDMKRNGEIIELKNHLDTLFNQLDGFLNRADPPRKFNWAEVLGTELYGLLQKRQSSNCISCYQPDQVMSLVKLVRDKHTHSADLKVELLQKNYFGVNGQFCELKFGNFFLKKFPYLVIFLYTVLGKSSDKYDFLSGLKRAYNLQLDGESDIPTLPSLEQYFANEKTDKGLNMMLQDLEL